MRARGPGDMENAMRSIERDYGIDYWFIYQLRYKRDRLKFLSVSVYDRLKAAYRAECERQMRKLQNEITITHPDHVAKAHAFICENAPKVPEKQG